MIDDQESRRRRAAIVEIAETREGRRLVGNLPERIAAWQTETAFLHARGGRCKARGRELAELHQEAERLAVAIEAELLTLEERVGSTSPRVAHSAPVINAQLASKRLLRMLSEISGRRALSADRPRSSTSGLVNPTARQMYRH
jgi:hypothetical protein